MKMSRKYVIWGIVITNVVALFAPVSIFSSHGYFLKYSWSEHYWPAFPLKIIMIYPFSAIVLILGSIAYMVSVFKNYSVSRRIMVGILIAHVLTRGLVDYSLVSRFNPIALGCVSAWSLWALCGGLASILSIYFQVALCLILAEEGPHMDNRHSDDSNSSGN
jgi:hypothetical protein